MVAPLIWAGVAAGAGVLGGFFLDKDEGKELTSKKEQKISQTPTSVQTFNTTTQNIGNFDFQRGSNVQGLTVDFEAGSTVAPKTEQRTTARTAKQTDRTDQSSGLLNNDTLLLAGVGVGAFFLLREVLD